MIVQMGYDRVPPTKRVKYCTDEHAGAGVPGCYRHDHSADPIDFFITSQETSLIMSLYNAQRGNMRAMQGHLFRSLNTVTENMNYINYPLLNGMQVDPEFPKKQLKAYGAIEESGGMYGLPFPEQIKEVYKGLTKLVIGVSTKQGAAESGVKAKLIEEFVKSASDSGGMLDRDSRLSGVQGLVNLKDAEARQALKETKIELERQSILPERTLSARMMDEHILSVVNNALDSYFQ